MVSPSTPELFRAWLEDMDAKLAGFEMFGLPEQFRSRPYTRESLSELQDVIRDRLVDVEHVTDGSDTAFVDGVVRYVGETLIRHAGGRWHLTTDADAPHRGRPVLVLDHADSTESDPVDVLGLVRQTVLDPHRDWLVGAFDLHVAAGAAGAAARPEDAVAYGSRLEGWLESMDAAIEAWRTGPGAPAERWDGSVASLGLLGSWALERFTPGTDPRELVGTDRESLDGASRYLGEALVRHGGGRWYFDEGEASRTDPFVGRAWIARPDPETRDLIAVVPELTLAAAVKKNKPDAVARKVASYLPRAR